MGLKFEFVIFFLLLIFAAVFSLVCIESGTITGKTLAKECDVSNIQTLNADGSLDNNTLKFDIKEHEEVVDQDLDVPLAGDQLEQNIKPGSGRVEFRCFITSASRERRLSEMRGCTKKGGCETIKKRLMRARLKNIMCKECALNLCNSAKNWLVFVPLLFVIITGRIF